MEKYNTYFPCLPSFAQHYVCDSSTLLRVVVAHWFSLLYDIILYKYTRMYLPSQPVMNIEVAYSKGYYQWCCYEQFRLCLFFVKKM